jgi:hypothetical protein
MTTKTATDGQPMGHVNPFSMQLEGWSKQQFCKNDRFSKTVGMAGYVASGVSCISERCMTMIGDLYLYLNGLRTGQPAKTPAARSSFLEEKAPKAAELTKRIPSSVLAAGSSLGLLTIAHVVFPYIGPASILSAGIGIALVKAQIV